MRRNKKTGWSTGVLAVLATVILLPALSLFLWAFTERWAWPDFLPQVCSARALMEILGRREQLARLFGSSILISTAVGLLSVAVASLTARAMLFYAFRGKSLLYFFTILPFLVPSTVFAMGIQTTFIRLGLNNTVWGVILSHLVCSLPYAVRLVMDGMEAVGGRLEEQARVLGAGAAAAFFRVTLPLLSPVLLSAMSMAYLVSFSQYFLTLLIGGGQVRTFTIVMVPYLQGGDRSIASIYSILFLAVTLAVFAAFEWIAGRCGKNMDAEFYG